MKKQPKIVIERGAKDHILPKHFYGILAKQYFPVLSLTYICSVIGIAYKKGDLIRFLFQDSIAYKMGLLIILWVSIPAVLWIILKGSHLFNHVAELWYILIAILLSLTLFTSFMLVPEADFYGLRIYFAATIPVFFVMYYFFVKEGLPSSAAYPLTGLGLIFLFYGLYLELSARALL